MGLAAITNDCFTLSRVSHVNCFAVNEIGPFSRLTAAVTVCWAAFLFWLFKIQPVSFFSAFFLWFCFSDASPMIHSVKTTI